MNIPVTCAIIMQEGRILVTQRSEKMSLPLLWEFPGGKIEPGETPEACLHREIREELNIDIRITRPLTTTVHAYGSIVIHLMPFLAVHMSGEIQLSEHKAFLWLPPHALEPLDWAPADVPVLKEFLLLSPDEIALQP